jgi:hypothetical protein
VHHSPGCSTVTIAVTVARSFTVRSANTSAFSDAHSDADHVSVANTAAFAIPHTDTDTVGVTFAIPNTIANPNSHTRSATGGLHLSCPGCVSDCCIRA